MTLNAATTRNWICTAIALVLAVFTIQPDAMAQDARLKEVVVTNTQTDLLLYLNVEGAFTGRIEDAVKKGVPTTFSFFITLNKIRNLWLDKEITDLTLTHTVEYDIGTKAFTIRRSWDENNPVTVRSISEARKLMTEIKNLKIVPLSRLHKGEKYRLRAKAELEKFELPWRLHQVLVFMSFWDFETDWYSIDFVY